MSLGTGWVSRTLVVSVIGLHRVENEGVFPFNFLKDGNDVDRSVSLEWSLKEGLSMDTSRSAIQVCI